MLWIHLLSHELSSISFHKQKLCFAKSLSTANTSENVGLTYLNMRMHDCRPWTDMFEYLILAAM